LSKATKVLVVDLYAVQGAVPARNQTKPKQKQQNIFFPSNALWLPPGRSTLKKQQKQQNKNKQKTHNHNQTKTLSFLTVKYESDHAILCLEAQSD